jgi:hypothetical protein
MLNSSVGESVPLHSNQRGAGIDRSLQHVTALPVAPVPSPCLLRSICRAAGQKRVRHNPGRHIYVGVPGEGVRRGQEGSERDHGGHLARAQEMENVFEHRGAHTCVIETGVRKTQAQACGQETGKGTLHVHKGEVADLLGL